MEFSPLIPASCFNQTIITLFTPVNTATFGRPKVTDLSKVHCKTVRKFPCELRRKKVA